MLVLVDLDALVPARAALVRGVRVRVLAVLARSPALVRIPLFVLGDALRVLFEYQHSLFLGVHLAIDLARGGVVSSPELTCA